MGAAITLALTLASEYGPAVITLIKQIKKKDGSTVTLATVVTKLDEGDADFADNIKADSAWFAAHGMDAQGNSIPPVNNSAPASDKP